MTLGIVVPCYNEEDVLPATCEQLLDIRRELVDEGALSTDSSIWFVDDGSSDATWSLKALTGPPARPAGSPSARMSCLMR